MEAAQEDLIRLKTIDEIKQEFERWFRAREDATENPLTSREDNFATRLADLKRETMAKIKTGAKL